MTKIRDEELLKKFGENLRRIRWEKGISQETLAFKANIQPSQVARIERGELNTTISTINIIAKALEIDLKELFNFS